MLRRWPVGFLCLYPPIKWWTKPLLNCSKFAIVPRDILLNHTLVAPFRVIGNALHNTSFGVICNSISVMNDSMWSKGSLEPLYDSSFGRWNFDRRRWFSTSVMNGESVLQIILSKFSCLYPSGHFLIHPSPSSCCEAHSPSWRNLFLRSCLACWLGSLILLHFGFHLFADVLHFGFHCLL